MRRADVLAIALTQAVALYVGSHAVFAEVVVYTDKAQWGAALGQPYSTETFDEGPVDSAGGSISLRDFDILVENHGFIPDTSLTWHDQTFEGTTTIFSFRDLIYAFGGDWDLTSYMIGSPNTLRLLLDGAAVETLVSDDGFFGVVSTTPFSDATVTLGNGVYQNWDVNDVTYALVPEPEVTGFCMLALGTFVARRRRTVRSGTSHGH